MAVIYEDTLQKLGKHEAKAAWFREHGIEVRRVRLNGNSEDAPVSFGDYWAPGSNICVDTKNSVAELAQDLCRDHARFRREWERANAAGFLLVILVENDDGYRSIEDCEAWVNATCQACAYYRFKRCDPATSDGCERLKRRRKPVQGRQLAASMRTIERMHGIPFLFCAPEDSARLVCEKLGVGYVHD